MTLSVTLTLPIPPSVNGLYRNVAGRGRVKTRKYEAWCSAAGWELEIQRAGQIKGPYEAAITLPPVRGDIDNRAKALLDLLVAHGVTGDDRLCRSLTVKRAGTGSWCLVEVRAVEPLP